MIIREQVPLSRLTTFKVGGAAQYVVECHTLEEVKGAVAFARENSLPYTVLGEGSNVLAADEGYAGVIIHMRIPGIEIDDESGRASAGAGVIWDKLVALAGLRGLWGIENLAGIPGTVGAAPIQNIGAYGSEVKDTLESLEAFDANTGELITLDNTACMFGYRDSRFKRERNLIITKVTFKLRKDGEPQISYKDLQARKDAGESLATPEDIARAVRDVRSYKFPDLRTYGTAGSFFKNPFISEAQYQALAQRYPELPGFPSEKGVKIPLAWILDHVLHLRDYRMGNAALFVRQPLVLITEDGATAADVHALAEYVCTQVERATGIAIEREVQTLL